MLAFTCRTRFETKLTHKSRHNNIIRTDYKCQAEQCFAALPVCISMPGKSLEKPVASLEKCIQLLQVRMPCGCKAKM